MTASITVANAELLLLTTVIIETTAAAAATTTDYYSYYSFYYYTAATSTTSRYCSVFLLFPEDQGSTADMCADRPIAAKCRIGSLQEIITIASRTVKP